MSQAATQKNSSTTAIIFAVFAVVCIVAFLSYRENDIWQLPKLMGNLGGGAIAGFEGSRDLFVGVAAGSLIVCSWFCFGSFIVYKIAFDLEKQNFSIEIAVKTAIGAAAFSFVWFFLGLAGLYNVYVGIVSILLSYFLGLFAFARSAKKQREPEEKNTISDKVVLFLIFLLLAAAFLSSVAPPIAKDTLLYHFSLPKAFVSQGSLAYIEGNTASYYPLGGEIQYVGAMILGRMLSERAGEVAAEVISFSFLPLLLMATFGWARSERVSRSWALIATLMIASVPTVYHIASSGYVDLSLALFVTLSAFCLTRWLRSQRLPYAAVTAIFLGAALSVKFTAIFFAAAFMLTILLRARESETAGKIVLNGIAVLVFAGAIASPWYLRNWVATGSPIFPFYLNIWEGKAAGWDVERSTLFQDSLSQYGGADLNKLNYLTAPVRVSITAQPEQPANYDGVIGVAFLIGLPLLIWALWKFDLAVEIKIMPGIAGVMYLFWIFSSAQLRYLLPVVPMLAIAIAASAERIGSGISKVVRGSLVAASVCGLLTSFAWFCQKAPVRAALGGESRDQYLTRNLDYYSYYQWINTETPPDAKVWLINMRRDTYNMERPVFSDYVFEDWTLRKMLWDAGSAQDMRTKTAAMGIKYVLTRHDFLFDYDRSTLVDDKKPRTENEAKLRIAKDLILDPANTIKTDNKFSLIKVF